jgi:hypothetical protein
VTSITEDYKGGRAETPVEIEHQFDLIRTMCEAMHIPVLGVERFEADDVLATLATYGRDAEIPVVVVSGDRDTFQLVEDPFVKVLYNRRGVSDYSLYDEAGIMERCGIEAARYPLWRRCAATRRTICPAYRASGRRRRPNCSPSTATSTISTLTSDTSPRNCVRTLAAFEERARNNERVMRWCATCRSISRSTTSPSAGGTVKRSTVSSSATR